MITLKNNMLKKGKRGFTLTELAIVIAVIAILIAVLVPTFTSVITNARETAAAEDATNAITAYTLENEKAVTDGSVIAVENGGTTYYFVVIGGSAVYYKDVEDTTTYSDALSAISNSSFGSGFTTFNWTYVVYNSNSTSSSVSNGEYYATFNGTVVMYIAG